MARDARQPFCTFCGSRVALRPRPWFRRDLRSERHLIDGELCPEVRVYPLRGWLCGTRLDQMVTDARAAARNGDPEKAIEGFREVAQEADRLASWLASSAQRTAIVP